jgi:hypothetical protein
MSETNYTVMWHHITEDKTSMTLLQKIQNRSLSILYEYFGVHMWRPKETVTGLKLGVSQIM